MEEREEAFYTKSGTPVYAYKTPGLHQVCISLYVKSGVLYENADETGITHFLEHIFFRSLNGIPQQELYHRLQRMGANFNGSTYKEFVCFDIKAAPSHFDDCAKIMAGLLAPLTATPADVAAERRRIQSEIRETDERSSLDSLAQSIVWEGTPLARLNTGDITGVRKIGLQRLRAFQREIFTTDNLFFYVTGSFSNENIRTLCREIDAFPLPRGGAPRDNTAPVPASFGRRGCRVAVRDGSYQLPEVLFSFDIHCANYSVAELDLLYDLLFGGETGRFKMALSEQSGLIYDFDAYLERYRNIGRLYASYFVQPGRLRESLLRLVQVLRSVKEQITQDDMALILPNYLDNNVFLLDNPARLNWDMAYTNKILEINIRSVAEYTGLYRKVTPERLKETARDIFRTENLVVAFKAKRHKIKADDIREMFAGLDD